MKLTSSTLKMKGTVYLSIFYFSICFGCLAMGLSTTKPVQLVNVGVILDTADAWIGKLCLSCIQMAHSDFYATHSYYNTRLVLTVKDSKSGLIAATSAAIDLIKNVAVQAIIGPQDSRQANLIIDVCNKARVPILSFSATSPSLTSPRNPYFHRIAQNECAQAQAISALFQAFKWKEVVLIYIQGIYSYEVIPCITRALQEANIRVSYQAAIPQSPVDDQIVQELHKLTTLTTRVFIVHMSPTLGSRFFAIAREIGMMSEGYVWILTTEITDQLANLNSSITYTMQGVLGVGTYFPKTKELQDFQVRWKLKFQQENPTIIAPELNVFCLWAYDAVTALARAVERAGLKEFGYQKTSTDSINTTDFETLGVSLSGPKLGESLRETRFQGLSGDFSLVDGEVNSSNFQIINVFGDGKKVVGFWTPDNGLVRKLHSTKTDKDTGTYSTSKTNLGPIIWPGDSTSVPEGRDLLANRKKLRIGVPVKPENGFGEFVSLHYDRGTDRKNLSGYCIDVFKVVMDALPYHVPYEFIPFNSRDYDSFSTGSFYDNLIQEVHLGKFDAAVGDITITAERSLYVDFTLPFTENEATFIVPTRQKNKKEAWIFLKPLTWELWVTSVCFFVFIGFVVWVLEHGVNKEFRGSSSHQVGTSLCSSFSTLVFTQWDRIHSNLAKFVVTIWVFVGLILTQSYTASLTTLLTVEQLRPAVTDVNQLIQNGDFVGYQYSSYMIQLLKQMGFPETKLRAYKSAEECDHLLTMGSRNGGIAAAFDETPYIKVLQSRYCSKYTTIGPTFRSQGFGFAFKRNSPFVPDVSRAILNLTEKNQNIEKGIVDKLFRLNESRCLQPSSVEVSYTLDLDSFRGLFLLSGITSSSALIIYTTSLLYKHKGKFMQFYANGSLWKRICIKLTILRQKDITIHSGEQIPRTTTTTISDIHDINVIDAS